MHIYNICKKIINWYSLNKRSLPFRLTRDPYKIWLSEVMLQQTQVITMKSYYLKWVKKYPNIKSVIIVPYEKVLKNWEGLGYYNRCLNFYNALNIVQLDFKGIIPKNYDAFKKLPGVGEYTASAVMSIAYNKKYVVIDGNVKRVFSRYLGLKKMDKKNILKIKNYLTSLIQFANPGIFNQSIMEIGALLCKKNKPKCNICPLKGNCLGYLNKSPQLYPQFIKKAKLKKELYLGLILRSKKHFLIIKSTKTLLKGLWSFPMIKINDFELINVYLKELMAKNLVQEKNLISIKRLGFIKHSYSHFNIDVIFYEGFLKKKIKIKNNMKWISKSEIIYYPFSKIFFKVINLFSI